MRIFSWLLGLIVAGAVVLFAIANRHGVAIEFWPMPLSVEAPLYLAMLGSLLAGLLIGMLIAWAAAAPFRARARATKRRLATVERELDHLRADAALPAVVAQPTRSPAEAEAVSSSP